VKNVSRELLKANDSIKKLQEQCNKLSQKVKRIKKIKLRLILHTRFEIVR